MTDSTKVKPALAPRPAVLDAAHLGDIEGAFGTIHQHDTKRRKTWKHRLATLLAIIGPGLIVMVGDNDAGAFGTYTQAGQNYGTSLLWTLLLLVPVLFVNQEMVARLGAVTGVGHARLIFERFGRFWGAFSVIDLFFLNGLTIVTEFIGISFALHYFGLPKEAGLIVSTFVIIGAVSTGSFRNFERFAMVLVFGSLLLVPVLVTVHPPVARIVRDTLIPDWPAHSKLADVMLLIIGIVGTTVAPWQLFFQQSFVVDKRITPAYNLYEKIDLWIGIGLVMIGAIAMIAFCAALFAGRPEFGNFTDAYGVMMGLAKYVGDASATVFAIALLDACIIGAAAVSLATAYAISDVMNVRHSLHRKLTDASGFYLIYAALIGIAAALVMTSSDTFLGYLTNAVQALAGVLLPSATVFLLLLCNDKAVLGPWVNGPWLNRFTGMVIWILVMLSVILTTATVFPNLGGQVIVYILGFGSLLGATGYTFVTMSHGSGTSRKTAGKNRDLASPEKKTWRMPPLAQLAAPNLTTMTKVWMGVLRSYLLIAVGLIVYKIIMVAIG